MLYLYKEQLKPGVFSKGLFLLIFSAFLTFGSVNFDNAKYEFSSAIAAKGGGEKGGGGKGGGGKGGGGKGGGEKGGGEKGGGEKGGGGKGGGGNGGGDNAGKGNNNAVNASSRAKEVASGNRRW